MFSPNLRRAALERDLVFGARPAAENTHAMFVNHGFIVPSRSRSNKKLARKRGSAQKWDCAEP